MPEMKENANRPTPTPGHDYFRLKLELDPLFGDGPTYIREGNITVEEGMKILALVDSILDPTNPAAHDRYVSEAFPTEGE